MIGAVFDGVYSNRPPASVVNLGILSIIAYSGAFSTTEAVRKKLEKIRASHRRISKFNCQARVDERLSRD